MRLTFLCVLISLASFWGGHEISLRVYPYYKVRETFASITRDSFTRFKWFYISRLNGESRLIRRVSSDILYAYCLFDLGEGDIQVNIPAWNRFQAAAVFSMNSDHYLSHRSLTGEALNFTLAKSDLPFQKGFIMLRRLSPGNKDHEKNLECLKI